MMLSLSGRLLKPLGTWRTTDKKWGAFYESTTKSMYIKTTQWNHFEPNTNTFTGHNTRYKLIDQSPPPTTTSHIAVAWIDRSRQLITQGIGKWEPQHNSERTPVWTSEWTSTISDENSETLAHAIQIGRAKAVTDGSYESEGSAGYCITYDNIKWRGACQVPGSTSIQCAYRSKLAGILALLYMVKQLCDHHHIDKGQLTIACDNIAAGKSLVQTHYLSPQQNHFDLIQAIYRLQSALPIRFLF